MQLTGQRVNRAAVSVEVLGSRKTVYVDEPDSLRFRISRSSEDRGQPLELLNVGSLDPNIRVRPPSFPRGLRLGPGEAFELVVPFTATSEGTLRIADFFVQLGEFHKEGGDQFSANPQPDIRIVPSLSRAIRLEVETLGGDENGKKILLTFKHIGNPSFDSVEIAIGPVGTIEGGIASLQIARFSSGEERRVKLTVRGPSIEVLTSADYLGERLESRRSEVIPSPNQTAYKPYRFLNTGRMHHTMVRLKHLHSEDDHSIEAAQGLYPLESLKEYRLEIKPGGPGTVGVRLHRSAERISVDEIGHEEGMWAFHLVPLNNLLFMRRVQLYYDVEGPDGTYREELHFVIKPRRWRKFQLALAIGAVTTLQGLGSAIWLLIDPGDGIAELLTEISPSQDIKYWKLLSIPGAWIALKVWDYLGWLWQE